MRKLALLTIGLFVAGLTLLINPVSTIKKQELGFSSAAAFGSRAGVSRREVRGATRHTARRTARRTSRRVNRRHNYYRSLPRGCVRITLNRNRYWDCGGLYYRSIVESGATVYIIVTP